MAGSLGSIDVSLFLRLVFEVHLWGYYFMAVDATLVVLKVLRRRVPLLLLFWLTLVTWAALNGTLVKGISERWPSVLLWQVLLMALAFFLFVQPLTSFVREYHEKSWMPPHTTRPHGVQRK